MSTVLGICGRATERKALSATRQKVGMLIEQWTRLCTISERALKRREAASVSILMLSTLSPDTNFSQADISRATMTLNTLTESGYQDPWGGPSSELASGVRLGLENASSHLNTLVDSIDQRVGSPLVCIVLGLIHLVVSRGSK